MRIIHFAFTAGFHSLTLGLWQGWLSLKRNVLTVLRRAEVVLVRNFGRALGVTVIASLLATSAPTAAPTLVSFAKETERIAVSRSHDSRVFSAFRRGLAYGSGHYWSLNNKLASKTTDKHEKGPQHGVVAAAVSPAPLVVNAPTNLTVTSTANNSINLSWTAPAGTIDNYQIERSQNSSGPFSQVGTSPGTNFNDTTVSSNNAYLYRVRAVSGGIPSSPSNVAVGTAITYADNPIQIGVTQVQAVHITQLRQSINAVRFVAGLPPATWTDTSLGGITIQALHIQQMRDKLGDALTLLNVPPTAYTDPVLSTGANGTPIRKAHIEELRQRASRSSSTSSGSMGGDLSTARLDPLNRIGGGGEDPLSRNFNWSIPLVSLPGRAGLDLGISLSYNSLVWTKAGSTISFDDDRGFPSPGFRLGFPVIQPLYFNPEVGKWAYLLITPGGSRVELRQVGTSALYESADSSHMLLDTSTSPMILRTTDGTQLSYEQKGSDFQCTKIKDRNGNFISVNYNELGRIVTIVDTLNRTINFNYENNYLSSIKQTWTINGVAQQHTWASFFYRNPDLTIQTNFQGLTNVGPQNGSTLKVLSQVTVNDGSSFTFDYTSWGQVWKISQLGTDGHLRNYRSYNLPPDQTIAQTDCPRFTQRLDWARNWNGDTNGVPATNEETITGFIVPSATNWTMPNGTAESGTLAQVTLPDGTIQKIYSHATGWDKGLPLLVETHGRSTPGAAVIKQKSMVTKWNQDNLDLPLNPRVEETNIYDFNGSGEIQNRARTWIGYLPVTLPDGMSCKLPQDVKEYQANASTVLRRTHTEYKLTSEYLSRRIIGLVREKTLFEVNPDIQAETLMSKVEFEYDETGSILGNDAPVQHDNTNYTASFAAGRANLSSVKRYNVINSPFIVISSIKYNTAGSVVQTTDASNHSLTLSYTDKFAQNGVDLDPALSFTTLAYPTTATDPDGYTSSIRYNYDFGAQTWKQTPLPNTLANTPGPQQKFDYDDKGRIERITNLVNNAYTKFIYRPNYLESFTTVNNIADEARSLQVFDGAGRVIAKVNNHPNSTGGFSVQRLIYDSMGRVHKQSNPTETSISITGVPLQPSDWQAMGDDAAAGWIYTEQTYDWNGRPLVTTNPSITGNPAETTTKEASYTGCGCAGGEVVTLTDEGTIDGGVSKRRQQKIYSDILGRSVKTEQLNWQGGSVYSTTVNTYNARDQVTRVRQFQGTAPADPNDLSCPAGTCQQTLMTYDGHGRLQTKHLPEQQVDPNNPASTDETTWEYNSDDTIQKVTDARGAVSDFGYNARHLLTAINYSLLPGVPTTGPSAVSATAPVTFGYDGAGNRTSMIDGSGSKSYSYNQLSQLMAETHTLNGVGSFTLSYDYNFAGDLKKVTDPTNMTINYGYDSIGRLNSVTGSDNLFMSITNYAWNFQYRAWGGLKSMTNGGNRTSSLLYNSRLQPSHFEINNQVSQNYDYYNDGRIRFVDSLMDATFDRSYSYNHLARLTRATTGGLARGDSGDTPYHETFGYDAFNNLTSRFTLSWGQDEMLDSSTYTNNRRSGWSYDADGRNITMGTRAYTFDAVGRTTLMTGQRWLVNHYINTSQSVVYDGDGRRVKEVSNGTTTYYLSSTILDGLVVAELNGSGQKNVGYVYSPGGVLLARQALAGTNSYIAWKHGTPAGTGLHDFNVGGAFGSGGSQRVEFDPLGASVPLEYVPPPETQGEGDVGASQSGGILDARWANFFDVSGGCMMDYMAASCGMAMGAVNSGAGVVTDPYDAPEFWWNHKLAAEGVTGWMKFQAKADGYAGYIPVGATYLGDGFWAVQRNSSQKSNKAKPRTPPTQVPVPVGGREKLRELLKQNLDYKNCRSALEKLFGQIASETGVDASHTDVLDLYDSLNKQTGGGGVYPDVRLEKLNDYVPKEAQLKDEDLPPGGGGLSWGFGFGPRFQRISTVFLMSAYSDSQKLAFERIPFAYFGRAVHELAHNAPKTLYRLFQHSEMDHAAQTLGSRDFDQYVKDHCIPEKYW